MLRLAQEEDRLAIEGLYGAAFDALGGSGQVADLARTVIAEVDGQLVGLGCWAPPTRTGGLAPHTVGSRHRSRRGQWWLTALAVRPEWRRRGVGTALADARIELAALGGADVVFVSCVDGAGSLELYQRLGFRRVGSSRGAHLMGVGATHLVSPLLWRR
jgi:ribosomal protein S18 acetylase RimI-like enzyme